MLPRIRKGASELMNKTRISRDFSEYDLDDVLLPARARAKATLIGCTSFKDGYLNLSISIAKILPL